MATITAPEALYPDGPKTNLGNQQSDRGNGGEHDFINNIENQEGLFEPIKEAMTGKYKDEATRAKAMTKRMFDLYKQGDPDVQAVVKNWELANKMSPGSRSGATLSEEAQWEAFMSHYGDLIGDRAEREDLSPAERKQAEQDARFDREGRNQMDMRKIRDKLR